MSTPQETALSAQLTNRQTNSAEIVEQPAASATVDPNNPPWSFPQALLTWFLSVALLLVPQVFALAYVAYHYQGTTPTKEIVFADKTFVLILLFGLLPVHALTLALAWAVVTRFGKVSAAKVLGWSWPAGFGIWKSVGLAIVLFPLALFISNKFGGQETDIERILESSRAAALLTAFLATATAPLVEE
ncbi:MAG TPA: hypothetical protein VHD88_06295, partial [Pyrinomonadaceae bacterium]|nr:hypothetical protein [Pyrinomonadaceae bacterium]